MTGESCSAYGQGSCRFGRPVTKLKKMDLFHELVFGNYSATTAIVVSAVPMGGAVLMVLICGAFCIMNCILRIYAIKQHFQQQQSRQGQTENAIVPSEYFIL